MKKKVILIGAVMVLVLFIALFMFGRIHVPTSWENWSDLNDNTQNNKLIGPVVEMIMLEREIYEAESISDLDGILYWNDGFANVPMRDAGMKRLALLKKHLIPGDSLYFLHPDSLPEKENLYIRGWNYGQRLAYKKMLRLSHKELNISPEMMQVIISWGIFIAENPVQKKWVEKHTGWWIDDLYDHHYLTLTGSNLDANYFRENMPKEYKERCEVWRRTFQIYNISSLSSSKHYVRFHDLMDYEFADRILLSGILLHK